MATTKYLDQYGLNHYHDLVKTEAVVATKAESANEWTGRIDAAGLAVGKTIILTVPAGATQEDKTLNLTLSTGKKTGPIPVRTIAGTAPYMDRDGTYEIAIIYDGTEWKSTSFDTATMVKLITDQTDWLPTLDKIYPVGSVYISVNAADPGALFGGTWERIQDRFLLSAGSTYAAGGTGGEATHKLTVEEMPSHGHLTSQWMAGSINGFSGRGVVMTPGLENKGNVLTTYGERGLDNGPGVTTTGGGAAHNNMPPYLTVYMWKRTA